MGKIKLFNETLVLNAWKQSKRYKIWYRERPNKDNITFINIYKCFPNNSSSNNYYYEPDFNGQLDLLGKTWNEHCKLQYHNVKILKNDIDNFLIRFDKLKAFY